MNMHPTAVPEYASGLADFDSLRRPVDAPAFGGARFGAHAKPPAQWITIAAAGLTAIIVVIATLVSAPVDRADTAISNNASTFDDRIRHNVEALRHSRAWWEGYGQSQAARAQRKGDRKTD